MTTRQALCVAATALLAAGLWLLLPRARARGRGLGAGLAAGSLGLFGYLAVRLDASHWISEGVFLILAFTTVVSALGAVSMRNPVYCAIWFGLTLLGTAGLFFYQGAQFLGVATVVVYAGAILVTFLFVLMLAQPQGTAYYDRVSWEGLLSACTGAVLVGVLTGALFAPGGAAAPPAAAMADRLTGTERRAKILHPDHVALLGTQLFSRHLVAVEVAGALLTAALVGAAVIVGQRQEVAGREGARRHG